MKKKKKHYIRELSEKYRREGATPACAHFGACGGCSFQDIPYSDQLDLKKELVNDHLQGIAMVERVHPSTPYRYRTRMDMVTAFGKCGLRQAGRFRSVVDIEACHIMQEKSDSIYRKIRPLILGIEGYDYLNHTGYLRYVVIRQALYTGHSMVNFVIAARENRLVTLIESIRQEVNSISLLYNDGLADVSSGEAFDTIKNGFIEESFDGIRYRITPNSFFQSNANMALRMYRMIREHARGRVLDLCAGVGSISLFVANAVKQVTGVELSRQAVDDANMNKQMNAINNAEFICSDVKDFLRETGNDYETIILDPPRSGMQRGEIPYISRINAEKIIYMSCNPASFRNDAAGLDNYAIESIEAYDMFPQTPHVELLAIFKRKK